MDAVGRHGWTLAVFGIPPPTDSGGGRAVDIKRATQPLEFVQRRRILAGEHVRQWHLID
ncbi:hypothetical protein GCM10029963_24590 [Micromonospora andamanensis]|uniref:Uncharacterized protein n=1 Tax=Micromonospora andamanensis TaxID=1287068 RepID=A0ABQ4HVW0_9ACTN|nr:hypothetical protein Van01_29890 [Micromonospora andamanensis]